MGKNSIKSNLTKEDIISDIVLMMGADIDSKNVYILVEGEDDIKFLRPFITENVLVYESYDGKSGVEFIVGKSFSRCDRVIGIRDRDYQIINVSNKIFYYDYSCMEMMLISCDAVFDNLCFEYYNGNVNSIYLKRYIFKELMVLSIIRMYNEREKWGLLLRGLSINKAWDKKSKKLDESMIIDEINVRNNAFLNEELLCKLKGESKHVWNDECYYLNTQGHDFFKLFAAICNQYTSKGVNYEELQNCARCIFREQDMRKTLLYRDIKEYSQKKNIKIFFS